MARDQKPVVELLQGMRDLLHGEAEKRGIPVPGNKVPAAEVRLSRETVKEITDKRLELRRLISRLCVGLDAASSDSTEQTLVALLLPPISTDDPAVYGEFYKQYYREGLQPFLEGSLTELVRQNKELREERDRLKGLCAQATKAIRQLKTS